MPAKKSQPRATLTNVKPTQNDPHNLRRLRRPTGPYARMALYEDPDATLDDLREAVKTLEDIEPIARRVLGGAHPLTVQIEERLQDARAALESAQAPDAVDASS